MRRRVVTKRARYMPSAINDGEDPLIYVRADEVVAKIMASLGQGEVTKRRALWVEVCEELRRDRLLESLKSFSHGEESAPNLLI
jgi:hypothetical protein